MTIIRNEEKPQRAEIKRMYNTTTCSRMLEVYVQMIKDKNGSKSMSNQEIVSALKEEFRYLITLGAFEKYFSKAIDKDIEDKRLQMRTLGIVYDEEQQETRSSDIDSNTDRVEA